MPLPDVTVDTNVLMHACNPTEKRHQASIDFVSRLLASTTCLAIDQGFSPDAAKNTSLIGAEYLAKLLPGSLPVYAITQMALAGRVVIAPAKLPPQLAKKLNQMVANRRDRTFVKVAANSKSVHLVSHDYADFSVAKRKEIKAALSVCMVDAAACCSMV